MKNTVLIKRRLASSPLNTVPALSGGELAFSEKINVLYYGSDAGTLAIGGDGAFVGRSGNQNILGNKTFEGTTTLRNTNFFANSLINFGGCKITNIGAPQSPTDAATKYYVDNLSIDTSNIVDRSTTQDVSGSKTFIDNAFFKQNLTVTGNLSVLGNSNTVVQTTVASVSSLTISNVGVGPALAVTQMGSNDVAVFYDDNDTSMIIKDGGNVGIGLISPGEKLTVAGGVSASGQVHGTSGTFIGSIKVSQGSTFSSDISGTWGTSKLINFIVDCGTF